MGYNSVADILDLSSLV